MKMCILPEPEPTAAAVEDAALMKSIADRDPEALSALYDRYSGILKALVIRVIHDEAEADDLLQEIFMQIWRQAKNYSQKKGQALGWIVTLTRRRAIDRFAQAPGLPSRHRASRTRGRASARRMDPQPHRRRHPAG